MKATCCCASGPFYSTNRASFSLEEYRESPSQSVETDSQNPLTRWETIQLKALTGCGNCTAKKAPHRVWSELHSCLRSSNQVANNCTFFPPSLSNSISNSLSDRRLRKKGGGETANPLWLVVKVLVCLLYLTRETHCPSGGEGEAGKWTSPPLSHSWKPWGVWSDQTAVLSGHKGVLFPKHTECEEA